MDEIVIYIIVRNDLGMSPGKVAAQVGHGVELALSKGREYFPQWIPTDAPCAKIILQANYDQLEQVSFMFGVSKSCLVIDEGRTEIPPNTLTVVSLVPAPKSEFMSDLKHLKLYK